MNFTNHKGEGPWDEVEKENWKHAAKRILENYFNNTGYKCSSPNQGCQNCQDGIDVLFELRFLESEGLNLILCNYVTVDYNRTSATSIRSQAGSALSILNRTDLAYEGSGVNTQITLVHETGHMLGLTHPGQHLSPYTRPPRGSIADYTADQESLMGSGMQLRMRDFQNAFCDHITDSNNDL